MRRLGVALLILVLTVQPVSAHGDQPSHWAEASILEVTASELIDMNRFHLFEKAITREEYAYLIYQLYEHLTGGPIADAVDLTRDSNFTDLIYGRPWKDYGQSFTDTDNLYIRNLRSAGLINGYPDATFKPDAPITREEIMTLYVRLLENVGYELQSSSVVFDDSDQISEWARDSVNKCVASGLIQGVGDNRVDPRGQATVQESLVVLSRILKQERYQPLQAVPGQKGAIVSDGRRTFAVSFDLFGNPEGIDVYEDYVLIGQIYRDGLMKDELILEDGKLYFIDDQGLFRTYDSQVTYSEYYPETDTSLMEGSKKAYLNDDQHLMVKDGTTGVIVDYGKVSASSVTLIWNYLVLKEEVMNGGIMTRYIPLIAIEDYLTPQ